MGQINYLDALKNTKMDEVPFSFFQLQAQGRYKELAAMAVHKSQGALRAYVTSMVSSRSMEMLAAGEEAGMFKALNHRADKNLRVYLWTQQHDDFLWLCEQSPEWKSALLSSMPWTQVLSKNFHQSQWSVGLAKVLEEWTPKKLAQHAHALQYMEHPTAQHIVEAACAHGRYQNPEQMESFRAGAGTWFSVRRALGLNESREELNRAFRQWWWSGQVHALQDLNNEVFAPTSE